MQYKDKSEFFWHTIVFAIVLVLPFMFDSPHWHSDGTNSRTYAMRIALNKMEIRYGTGFILVSIIGIGMIIYIIYFLKYLRPIFWIKKGDKFPPAWLLGISALLFLAFAVLLIVYGHSYPITPGLEYNPVFKFSQLIYIKWITFTLLVVSFASLTFKTVQLINSGIKIYEVEED